MSRQFKGASATQDTRYSDKEKKLLKTLKFPPIFKDKVDIRKINIQVLRPWIASQISSYLGLEDDVVIEYVYSLLEEHSLSGLDPKRMQIKLTGFLEDNTSKFMSDLWKLLLSAQDSIGGIPKEFLEAKKEEIRKKMEQDEILERELKASRSRNTEYSRRRSRSRERRRDRSPRSPVRRYDRSPRSPVRRYDRSPDIYGKRSLSGERRRERSREREQRNRSRSRSRDKNQRDNYGRYNRDGR